MIINSNIAAIQTSNTLLQNEDKLKKSIKKLSSGKSITTAADDSSGLAISEKMKAQIRGLDQAASNVVEAGSLLSTAESNIETITELMQRMRELTVKAANETTTIYDREIIQDEINSLANTITEVASNSEFNTIKLLDGSIGGGKIVKTKPKETSKPLDTLGNFNIVQPSQYIEPQMALCVDMTSSPPYPAGLNGSGFSFDNNPVPGDVLKLLDFTGVDVTSVDFEFLMNGTAAQPGNIGIQLGSTLEETMRNMANVLKSVYPDTQLLPGSLPSYGPTIYWPSLDFVDLLNERIPDLYQIPSTGGTYQFNLQSNLKNGDSIEFNGFKFTAGEDFAIGSTTQATTANLAKAMQKIANRQISPDWINAKVPDYYPPDFVANDPNTWNVKNTISEILRKVSSLYHFSMPSGSYADVANAMTPIVLAKGLSLKEMQDKFADEIRNAGINLDVATGNGKENTIKFLAITAMGGISDLTFTSSSYGIIKNITDIPALDSSLSANPSSLKDAAWEFAITLMVTASEGASIDEARAAGMAAAESIYRPIGGDSFQDLMKPVFRHPITGEIVKTDLLGIQVETMFMELHNFMPYENQMSHYTVTAEGNTLTISEQFWDLLGADEERYIVNRDPKPPMFTAGSAAIPPEDPGPTEIFIPGRTLKMQIGANSYQSMSISINDMRAEALGIFTPETADGVDPDEVVNVTSHDRATASLDIIDSALAIANSERAKLGIYQVRLDHTENNLKAGAIQMTEAESRISDLDMAKELNKKMTNDIRVQAAQSMLKNAYQIPQGVLELLKGNG